MCEAGKFGASEGASLCTQCPENHYAPGVGQTECKPCPDARETNTPEFMGCVLDESLLTSQSSLVDSMFMDGLALYGTAGISIAFLVACGAMQLQKEGWADKVGQMQRFQVALKSFLPGFSFGSEVFLIFAIWSEPSRRALAVIMLLFRLLHPFGVLFVLLSMFGGEGTKKSLSGLVEGSSKWFEHFNVDFSRDKTPFVGLILLLSMGDVSLVQMLPWNKSVFHTESKGFPCLSLLEFCLGLDTWQASASVICQIIYLGMSGTINDATTSPQAKALFGLNISISIIGVVMGLLMLYLKDNLMKAVGQRKSVVLGATDDLRVGEGSDDHVELGEITSYTDNPLHTQERTIESNVVMERGDASATNETAGQPTNISTVPQQEQHERVVEEIETLKAEIRELKKKQSELDEKQRTHDRKMLAVKAEKSQIEERASRAEAELAEMKAKLDRTGTGTQ